MRWLMNKIAVFAFGLFMAGLYLSWVNPCWSYLAEYTPPSSDIFFVLMMLVWHTYPYIIMFLGIALLLLSARKKNITEVDD
jgi:hypothetical protein